MESDEVDYIKIRCLQYRESVRALGQEIPNCLPGEAHRHLTEGVSHEGGHVMADDMTEHAIRVYRGYPNHDQANLLDLGRVLDLMKSHYYRN